ncbi:glycerate kinase [Microbacterium endophyticum]|uniref:Glycerate kinase n=1 Tax=Microbacterium endophyticum TaxID=1526412 RepID=A0A7W4YLL2_9MICO|nr:glycerate kinase [Microbacterium endophyticum]MBB2975293.1 glycerate kinase [Microbacterium endophyticum]NIK35688.1 glycerate kinase [Microbacterium endophyticum]
MTRVVFAPDSFKGSISAADAAAALASGWSTERPGDAVELLPMADGGEGTVDAFALALPHARRMPVTVTGPDGAVASASWLLVPGGSEGGTAVVELASTSGIEMLGENLLPLDAQTLGFGQAIAAALDHGVERLVLGIGSSASTDAGAGMLTALGAKFFDASHTPVRPGLRGLNAVAQADMTALRALPPGGVIVLSDVTNPLCGSRGAAAVFGPQKGLIEGIAEADRALARFAKFLGGDPDAPGAGAAGGTGFALAVWGATLVPGAGEVARLIGLPQAIAAASVVVTGEGSFDGQSADGKAPAHVAMIAAAEGTRVNLVAGRIDSGASTSGFAGAVSLTALAGSARSALAEPARWLVQAGATLARAHAD